MKKKFSTLILLSIVLISCKKEIIKDELLNSPAVLTLYDQNIDFSNYQNFYISDTIGVVTDNSSNLTALTGASATSMTNKVKSLMQSRGYLSTSKNTAEIGINVTILKELTDVYTDYYAGYWWGYDGYYGSSYWGYSSSPYYYGYTYDYTYESGSLLIELIDLKNAPANNKLKIIWNAEIGDIFGGSINTSDANALIEQAFTQSEYLKR